MVKTEMFNAVLTKCCEECDALPEEVLTCCRRPNVVDARVLTVQYTKRLGLTNKDIAAIVLKKLNGDDNYRPPLGEIDNKARGVEKMFASYTVRCFNSKAFRMSSVKIKNFCNENYHDDYIENKE